MASARLSRARVCLVQHPGSWPPLGAPAPVGAVQVLARATHAVPCIIRDLVAVDYVAIVWQEPGPSRRSVPSSRRLLSCDHRLVHRADLTRNRSSATLGPPPCPATGLRRTTPRHFLTCSGRPSLTKSNRLLTLQLPGDGRAEGTQGGSALARAVGVAATAVGGGRAAWPAPPRAW